ncbi:uncharacterized protein LOC125661064 [Ostrea edulis]|uniref:uncharacterized protein LOC125661064 n=1 Tax=Ostrea edulis TaxID=37623 RepID=UPI0024AF4B4D|nr:uncharacterized protein LOC125661064 [Ostrea edulis]
MDTLGLSTQLKVRQCSKCQGDTNFYCNTCKRDLCLQCKEKHVIDLDTIYHDVVIYREKFKYIPFRKTCVRHPNRKYRMFCDDCNYSLCRCCTEHSTHTLVDLKTAYQTKRQQYGKIIDIISKKLFNCHVLLVGIQTDIETCPPQICHHQSQQMSTKAQRLKDLIDTAVCGVKTIYRGVLIDRIQQQKRKMNRHLTHIHNYEDRYEQSANRAVQFLLFIKINRVPQIKDTPNLPQHLLLSLTEGFNMEDVEQLLMGITEIQMTTGKRQKAIKECLELTSTPVLHKTVYVGGVTRVFHISGVMSKRIWVSDADTLVFRDREGVTVDRVIDKTPLHGGIHTVNNSGELIYIDKKYNINKLSLDNETVTTLLGTTPWKPRSVYCSPVTGDMLVGMRNTGAWKHTGKVTRYDSSGQHMLTIQYNNTGNKLYSDPHYITENKNGDIIVSDALRGAVVVTERGGKHRFSYRGPPSQSSLDPWGICSDARSHILVCDYKTHTVQMIDKDGHFLCLLLTSLHRIYRPRSLNYDDRTHLLWVGSLYNNEVSVYRYKHRRYYLNDIQAKIRDRKSLKL